MGITIIPHLTTTQRDVIPAFIRATGLRIFNITTNQDERWDGAAWVAVGGGSGSFTPLTYIAPPSDNDASRQAFLTALHADMVSKGVMLPPPMFTISGQVTGSVQDAITVELRDNGTNALLETVSTNGTGNYTFTPRVAGTYKVIPSIAGHYFTPSAPVLTVSANVVQDFANAVATPSANTSPTHVFLPLGSATPKLRAVAKATRTLEPELFPDASSLVYVPTYHNNRWFVPCDTRILVYDDARVLRTTIFAGAGTLYRVHAVGNKLCIIGSTGIRFGTYTNGSPDVWTAGNFVAQEVAQNGSTLYNGEAVIASVYTAAPLRNITRYNITTEAITRQSFGTVNLVSIAAGTTTLCLHIASPNQLQIVNAATLAAIGSPIPINVGDSPRNIAFSQGRYWAAVFNAQNALIGITEAGVATTYANLGGTGCIADENFIYSSASGTGLRVVNSSTGVIDGSTLALAGIPSFFTS
jgi:hypothetical protein